MKNRTLLLKLTRNMGHKTRLNKFENKNRKSLLSDHNGIKEILVN